MNYFIFSTGGDWDSTTLYNNGEEFLASKLYLELNTGRDEYGQPIRGRLRNGGEMTAYALPQVENATEFAIFPGRIDLEFPTHKVTVENNNAEFAIEFTQIWLDNVEVTDQVIDLNVNIDAVNNEVSAAVTLYKPHFLASDEIASYNLL